MDRVLGTGLTLGGVQQGLLRLHKAMRCGSPVPTCVTLGPDQRSPGWQPKGPRLWPGQHAHMGSGTAEQTLGLGTSWATCVHSYLGPELTPAELGCHSRSGSQPTSKASSEMTPAWALPSAPPAMRASVAFIFPPQSQGQVMSPSW